MGEPSNEAPKSYVLGRADFLRMARTAFDTKNSLTRMGVKKDQAVIEIAKALEMEAEGK